MSDIYLQITETPAVVTLSAPVISAALSSTVTVANVVSVNVVTMPAINVTAAVSGGLSNAELRASAVSVAVTTMPAISISSVTVSNFPASQTVAGTVTIGSCVTHGVNVANSVTISSLPAISGTVTIGAGTAQIGSVTASISGTVPISISSVTIGNSVTISSLPAISGTVTANAYNSIEFFYMPAFRTSRSSADCGGYFQRVNQNTWQCGKSTDWGVGIQTFYWSGVYTWIYRIDDGDGGADIFYFEGSNAHFPVATTLFGLNGYSITSGSPSILYIRPDTQPISGTVTVGNSVTVSSLPVQLSTTTIGGTARLNVTLSSATTIGATAPSYGNLYGGSDGTNLRAISVDTSGRTVVTGSVSVANTVPVSGTFWQATQPVSGTVTANISGTVPVSISSVTIGNTVTVAGTVTANVASTTVTISAQPSGALTTRFGSVVTANTAGITTAVTNTSRKYLLAQNISAGTVTIGIGFSPTTTQGIQLTAGAGLTFDSFVPTGAVYWLGATTGAAYTILEG